MKRSPDINSARIDEPFDATAWKSSPWVDDMNAHFQKNGRYRNADLWKAFGDPSAGLDISTVTGQIRQSHRAK